MTTFAVNVKEEKKKQIPTEKEAKEILAYFKANPESNTALDEMMEKYNCSKLSVQMIVVHDIMRNPDN